MDTDAPRFHVMSNLGPGLRVREHRTRRHHTKDRHGCSGCKQRRVKCDQRQPACLRCSRNHRECVYESSPPAGWPATPAAGSALPDEVAVVAGGDGATTAAAAPLSGGGGGPGGSSSRGKLATKQQQQKKRPSPPSGPVLIMQPAAASLATMVAEPNSPWIRQHGTPANHLLHHFSHNSATIMGSTVDPRFWSLACRYDFLVSTMLAVSACHLRHYTPNPAAHQIAELGQEEAAISALKPALRLPLQGESADALLSTAIMLNAVTFAFVEGGSVATSWVFSGSADRLGWLDLMLRFKKLEKTTWQFRQSACSPPSPQPPPATPSTTPNAETDVDNLEVKPPEVPAAWRMLIGDGDEEEDGDDDGRRGQEGKGDKKRAARCSLYRGPVHGLAELRALKPDCPGSVTYIGFVGKLEDGFRDLLFERDPAALWILGYWLGLLGRLNIWWCARRVERDWAAVLCFLRETGLQDRPGDEGRMWRVLIDDLSTASAWPPTESLDPLKST